jgi:hypothetical protein
VAAVAPLLAPVAPVPPGGLDPPLLLAQAAAKTMSPTAPRFEDFHMCKTLSGSLGKRPALTAEHDRSGWDETRRRSMGRKYRRAAKRLTEEGPPSAFSGWLNFRRATERLTRNGWDRRSSRNEIAAPGSVTNRYPASRIERDG